MNLKKYEWQKPHQSNLQVLTKLIIQIKIKIMLIIKNIKAGNLSKLLIFFLFFFFYSILSFSNKNNFIGTKTDIKILDKISSKNELIKIVNKW